MKDKRHPRLYFMLVELEDGDSAALLIMRFATSFGAQLTGHDKFLRQISAKVERPDFEAMDLWYLLAMVEKGFQQVHGIRYEYFPPTPGTTLEEWAKGLEARAADPRYVVFERPGDKAWHYGINADDMAAIHREMRLKKAH